MHNTINKISLAVLILFSNAAAFEYPQDLGFSEGTDALLDAGYFWKYNSSFHPISLALDDSLLYNNEFRAYNWLDSKLLNYSDQVNSAKDLSENAVSVAAFTGVEFRYQNGSARRYNELAVSPYLQALVIVNKKWYANLFVRASNQTASLPHYSGVAREISRGGFNTGEFDQAYIGYDNGFVQCEFGRRRQIWGPFSEDNLSISGASPSWEQLSLGLKYKRFIFRYFFGSLRTEFDAVDDVNIQRYIAGRAVEYSNFKNFVVSAGEVTCFAGPNRPIDFAILNPLALQLEIETNDRENEQSRNSSNSILFLNIDWLLYNQLRLSGTFLLDDIQLDKADRDAGADDALGFLGRIAWTPIKSPLGLTLFAEWKHIDTYVYRAAYDYANQVNFGFPMGHPLGNDAEEYSFSTRCVFRFPLMVEAAIGERKWGDGSVYYNSYDGYPSGHLKGPFPSGTVRTNRFLKFKLDSQLRYGFEAEVDGWVDLEHSGHQDAVLERYEFTLRYIIPISFNGL
ncbi:capsule assembly Wzi family protein [bacterium]|nr:capsule assembly Wzi family protein [bacterium]